MSSPQLKKRREALLDAMQKRGPDSVAVLAAAPVLHRNSDVEHEYRQDSDFFYLTGFSEPESVLVLSARDRKMTLFVRPRDPERETWDGPRAGVDGAVKEHGADQAFPISELDAELPKLLGGHRCVFYRLGHVPAFDARLLATIERGRGRGRSPVAWPSEFVDPGTVLHELRLLKEAEEIATMRRAAQITGEGHRRVMAAGRPGAHEYELEAILLETFRRGGAERVAYSSIVGSGPNATILHYRAGSRRIEDGELVLVDAGCELDYLASDVTRTFPSSGKFSREQRAVYEVVLEAQLACIDMCRPGASVDGAHKKTVEVLVDGLLRIGLLSGERDKLIEAEAYKRFYMHRTSHWLGMDVHDVGSYYVDGQPRPLAAGMVLTVEPGLYVSRDDTTVGPEWRGIGVRIEDDVVVTDGAPLVLTADIPKTVDEVERACRAA